MSLIVVVTGSAGSGKTTLSQLLAPRIGLRYVNVGDALASALPGGPEGVERRSIGPAFLRRYGIKGYVSVLGEQARSHTLFDGVRLDEGLQFLRQLPVPMVHVFRRPAPGAESEDWNATDASLFEFDADVIVPWYRTPSEARQSADALASDIVQAAARSRSRRPAV